MTTPQDILDFWFGDIADGWTTEDHSTLWFLGRADDDARIFARFGNDIIRAINGDFEEWLQTPEGTLALILLLDQMTRATRRGTVTAFAGDARALQICQDGITAGSDQKLPPVYRIFFYLPLEHSENLAHQERCVALYATLRQSTPERESELAQTYVYALKHRDIIAQFGRFPHRNEVLNRTDTVEERTYLESTDERFGQQAK
ncbi:DUF924 domain-containing protein [Candidatus Persebacteraceae bacterium Df01]|jgi:uncharacterized protein (DUF924 family)|uniref:DUF924 domain-containing protein n=1 Tax=Candidatus Doriopsillibacter californiensis TaxID=2970740 RepID=A0ABT7QLU1_9GAMM|nr:DUF924 domain-containing protein [Candidatus Persebacteraceae bacterium Df01]